MPFYLAAALGALGWSYLTRETSPTGERETVFERIVTNLGAALFAAGAGVAVFYVWKRSRG